MKPIFLRVKVPGGFWCDFVIELSLNPFEARQLTASLLLVYTFDLRKVLSVRPDDLPGTLQENCMLAEFEMHYGASILKKLIFLSLQAHSVPSFAELDETSNCTPDSDIQTWRLALRSLGHLAFGEAF